MDEYVHSVYKLTKKFPKDELYGVTSQLRRSSLSVVLNYIEGYARSKQLVRLNFFETAYSSLKESKYLLHFSLVENYFKKNNYGQTRGLAEEIGAMLWKEINNLNNKTKKTTN